MNDQLQKSMAEILALLTESAKTIGTAAQQEIPLLVQEYLRWGLWSAGFCALFAVIAWAAAWMFTGRFKRAAESFDDSNKDWMSGSTRRADALSAVFWVRLIASVLFGGVALYNGYVALGILIAPRVYLLQQVREMVR